MKKFNYVFFFLALLISSLLLSCVKILPSPDVTPNVPIYTYPPGNNQPGNSQQQNPDSPIITYPPTSTQPDTGSKQNPPVIMIPDPGKSMEDYIERNIVVDAKNNTFPIGIPAGYLEKTEFTAQKPVDFWFEYLTADARLEINGVEVKRNPFIWETKIGFTKSVTKFNYQISNTTGQIISYNLHLLPSVTGDSIPVIVRQRWQPLAK
jgi:hypothetical protein